MSEDDLPPQTLLFQRQATTTDPHGDDDDAPPPNLPTLSLGRQATTTDPHDSHRHDEERRLQMVTAPNPFDARDLIGMTRVNAPVVSPNGSTIVFAVKQLDSDDSYHEEKNSKWSTNLWLINMAKTASDEKMPHRTRLTSAVHKSDINPVFLDDETVAFLSNRSGSMQMWTINIHGGEAKQVTKLPLSVGNLQYNATKGIVAFTLEVYPDIKSGDVIEETKRKDEEEKKNPAKFMKYTKLFVRHWDSWFNKKRSHIFLQRLVKTGSGYSLQGTPIDAMHGLDGDCPIPPFGSAEQFAISPQGDELAYSMMAPTDSSIAWSTNSNIYTVKIELKETKTTDKENKDSSTVTSSLTVGSPSCLTKDNPGYDQQPLYSPDGKSMAWLSMKRAAYESDKRRLFIVDRSSGMRRQVFDSFDVSIAALVWAHDSKKVIITADHGARERVFLAPLDSEPKCIISDHFNSNVSLLGKDGLVFTRDSFNAPAEIFMSRIDGSRISRLTDFNDSRLKRVQLSTAQEFFFKGANNDKVQAWVFKPTDFQESHKYPIACVIHGGPQGAIQDHWHYRWNPQTLAAQGFAVLCINFHGSTGFGQDFTDSIRGDWGGSPFTDIMLGLEYAIQNYAFLDGKRAAALGASYGGFMINWINGHTDRFKCLVNHCGIFNQTAMYFATEELFFMEYEFKGTPWQSPLYDTWSPHKFVDKWKTPTLIVHGGKDFRVIETEGLATFTALQRLGVPSELLYFPDENHWVLDPANSVVWHAHVLAWLNKWI